MSAIDWMVIAAGATAIGWVNWYFLFAGRQQAHVAVAGTSGRQEVVISVAGGYDPAVVRVRAGEPVTLIFDRQEAAGCSEEVVLPDFRIRRFLPPFERTTIEITPEHAGSYEFTCGMGMLRGRVVAEVTT